MPSLATRDRVFVLSVGDNENPAMEARERNIVDDVAPAETLLA